MKIRLSKYDKLWSKLIRDRDDNTCQVCGNTPFVSAHHVRTRSIKSLRLEPANGISLCAGCHVFNHKCSAHKTPEAFIRWFKKRYPDRWKFIKKYEKQHQTEKEAVAEFQKLLDSRSQ